MAKSTTHHIVSDLAFSLALYNIGTVSSTCPSALVLNYVTWDTLRKDIRLGTRKFHFEVSHEDKGGVGLGVRRAARASSWVEGGRFVRCREFSVDGNVI